MRAVHHLDLWVGDAVTAEGEWGWLLGELGWEADIRLTAWMHPDGTWLLMKRSADLVDEAAQGPARPYLALTCDDRLLLDRVRAESSAHGWHQLYADRYPHAGGDDHVALYLQSTEGFEVEVVLEPGEPDLAG